MPIRTSISPRRYNPGERIGGGYDTQNRRANVSAAARSPVFVSDAPGIISREWSLAQSALGVQPWYGIRLAANGANHDYIYNHTAGPDWLRGLNADLGIYNAGPDELLSWDGAIQIFEYLNYAVHNGHEIDWKGDPIGTNDTINDIISKTGLLPEHVWNFTHNLDRILREQGLSSVLRPSLEKIEKQVDNSMMLLYVALAIGGLVALRYVFGPFDNANR